MKIFSGQHSSGFTLLEVMIAVCLLALGLVPLLVTHSNTIGTFVRSKELTYQGLLAEEKMALIEAAGFAEPFSAAGEEDLKNLKWVENLTSVSDGVMLKAEVDVSRRGEEAQSQKKAEVRLATYIVNLDFSEEEEEEAEQ